MARTANAGNVFCMKAVRIATEEPPVEKIAASCSLARSLTGGFRKIGKVA
jgi:hypothetical protein